MRAKYLATAISLVAISGVAIAADSYRLEPGETKQITEHNICSIVTHNGPVAGVEASQYAAFIPTRSKAEWESFIKNAPSFITRKPC